MWKKKLNVESPVSTLLLRRGAPAPRGPPTIPITAHTDLKQISPLLIFSSLSHFPRFQIKNDFFSFSSLLSSSRVRHAPSVPFRHFCSSSSISAENLCCWNCNSLFAGTTPFLVCENCGSVQPVDHSVDYFTIFGQKKSYAIEEKNLDLVFRNWQKKLHPDIVHTKSQKEREYAAEQSARVTTAYRTLTDNLGRAIYFLKLEGVEVDEEETITEPELLNEIMEIRESVEAAADPRSLHQVQKQVIEKLKYWSETLTNAFESNNYEDCLAPIRRIKYYRRASEEVFKKL